MMTENEVYIGDQNNFAIRHVPGYTDKERKYQFAYCHLVLGGQLIGYKHEVCYLNSWKSSVENLKDKIKNNFNLFCHEEFKDKSDDELFEILWKADQVEEEYKPEYKHLPVLDNKVWSNCYISIDETTDAYIITMTEQNGMIKFIWRGLRDPCPVDKIDKLYSITVDKNLVLESMEKCLAIIEKEYSSYPVK